MKKHCTASGFALKLILNVYPLYILFIYFLYLLYNVDFNILYTYILDD